MELLIKEFSALCGTVYGNHMDELLINGKCISESVNLITE